MPVIFVITTFITVCALGAIVYAYYKWIEEQHEEGPVLNEPDLKLVDRPDLIAKIPENDTRIPDANASDKDSTERAA